MHEVLYLYIKEYKEHQEIYLRNHNVLFSHTWPSPKQSDVSAIISKSLKGTNSSKLWTHLCFLNGFKKTKSWLQVLQEYFTSWV